MQIENVKVADIVPYANNPRHNDEAVEYVANSIREFGFKVPVILDRNNVIVTGHTRIKAAKMLGMETVPCIRADDLTDEQIRAFRLADNKVGEIATWDWDKLDIELEDIEIDMSSFGLEIEDIPEAEPDDDDGGYYGDERERTNRAYHLDLIDWNNLTNDFWQMPIIRNNHFVPQDLVGFNYAKTNKDKGVGIHFYVDDYQFERVWNYPEKYVDILNQYDCILTPDFSLYMDMPMPMKIWNIYRSRQIGAYYQSQGLIVIPTISWAEPETYKFCFQGIPEGSIVSVSTVGVMRDENALETWSDGMREMIRQINPSDILLYGSEPEFDYGSARVHHYTNKVTENWAERDVV